MYFQCIKCNFKFEKEINEKGTISKGSKENLPKRIIQIPCPKCGTLIQYEV